MQQLTYCHLVAPPDIVQDSLSTPLAAWQGPRPRQLAFNRVSHGFTRAPINSQHGQPTPKTNNIYIYITVLFLCQPPFFRSETVP